MFKKSIIRKNLFLSLLFGLFMGIAFPIFASFFVQYNDDNSRIIFISLCIIAGLVVGISAFLITKFTIIKIVLNIDSQLSNLLKNGTGDVNIVKLDSHDVLGNLVNNFNHFIKSLSTVSTTLNRVVERDDKLSEYMIEHGKTVVNSEKKVITTVESISGILQENSLNISDAVNLSTNIKDKMNELYSDIELQKDEVVLSLKQLVQILDMIDTANSTILEQVINSDTILDLIRDTNKKTTASNDVINSLSEDFNLVLNEIGKINEISERTSILAINASIEAARAGEVGKGFKIIATEVRELSESSRKYSDKISDLVKNMSLDMNSAKNLSMENIESLSDIYRLMGNFNGKQNDVLVSMESIKSEEASISKKMNILSNEETIIMDIANSVVSQIDFIVKKLNKTNESSQKASDSVNSITDGLKDINKGTEEAYSLLQKNEEEIRTSETDIKLFTQQL